MSYRMPTSILRPAFILLAMALFMVPAAFANTIIPNAITPIGPGFHLNTSSSGNGLLDPCWFVGFGGPGQTLNLGNPGSPVLSAPPDPVTPQSFSLFWGSHDFGGNTFVYTLPRTAPNANGAYLWSASLVSPRTGLQVASFQGSFQFTLPRGNAIVSWVVNNPGPAQAGHQTFQINFGLASPGPISFQFSVTETTSAGITAPLSFTPVPEPGSLLLLGTGLLGVVGAARRKWLS